MKIAAFIDEFNPFTKAHRAWIDQIRQETKADYLIGVMSGNFTQRGLPARSHKQIRAEAAQNHGVDMILELPVYAALTSSDTYATGATALLEQLKCIHTLCIAYEPCGPDAASQLKAIARFLFIESREYQLELSRLRSQGLDFNEARAQAVDRFIPGAGALLSSHTNILAIEYMRALKRMYSNIKPHLIPCEYSTASIAPVTNTVAADARELLDAYTAILMEHLEHLDHPAIPLEDIYGGTQTLCQEIRRQCAIQSTFSDLAQTLATPTHPYENICRYLFSLIIGIRKADISICRLYSFAVYARVLMMTSDAAPLLERIKSAGWIPVLIDPAGSPDNMDLSCRMLAELDLKADLLYNIT